MGDSNFVQKKCRYIFLLAIGIGFFYMIYPVTLTVADDLQTYTWVRRGILKDMALSGAYSGRITHLYNTILLGIPMLANQLWVYKAFSYGSILFDVIVFYILLKKYGGERIAYLAILLFFSMATITNKHNLFISYVFCHQIIIGLILLSIYWFLEYYESRKLWFLAGSAVLYTIAFSIYEGMVPFIFAFIAISWAKEKKIRYVCYDLRFHLLLLIMWLTFYFGWQKLYPTVYDGGQFFFGDPIGSLLAMIIFSTGAFPLGALFGTLHTSHVGGILSEFGFFHFVTGRSVLVAFLVSLIYAWQLPKIFWDKSKKQVLIGSIMCMFIPNLVLCLTYKYINWARDLVSSYLTSFYSWFFMIVVFVLFSVFIYQKGRRKKLLLFLLSIAVFAGSLGASINNAIWRTEYMRRNEIQTAFEQMISHEKFLNEVKNDTYILITKRQIPSFTLQNLSDFAQIYTDKQIVFIESREQIPEGAFVLEVHYDSVTKKYVLN